MSNPITNNTALEAAVAVVDGLHDVPTADATSNAQMRDVVGNKEDAGVTAVGTTKSAVAYLKGLIQELAQRAVPKLVGAYLTSSSYSDVVNITDKGVLTGITFRQIGTDNISFILTIDGTAILNGTPIVIDTHTNSLSLPFNHRFNSSLRLQVKNSDNVTGTTTWVSYTVDA